MQKKNFFLQRNVSENRWSASKNVSKLVKITAWIADCMQYVIVFRKTAITQGY